MKLAFDKGEQFAQVSVSGVSESSDGLYLQTQGHTPENDDAELTFNVGGTEVYNYGEDAKANLKLQINTHYKEVTVSNQYAVVVDNCVFQKVV